MTKCLPLDDPKNLWTFCPSLPAAIVFSVLFAATTSYHIYQAHSFKKTFCWVLIMGAIWETAAFVIRIVAIQNPTSEGAYDPHFILILLAPLWINAFDYMLLGRMVYYYLPEKRLFGIRAERMALCFVLLDLLSFVIQIGGGLMTISKNFQTLQNGLHIYTAGVALQEFFIIVFVYLVVTFQRRISAQCTPSQVAQAKKLLWVMYLSLALITFRILFRIIEFSAGAGTKLTHEFRAHEVYQYVFDAVPMFFALVAMNVLHPGQILQGRESEFKSRKERKREAKERREGESSDGTQLQVLQN